MLLILKVQDVQLLFSFEFFLILARPTGIWTSAWTFKKKNNPRLGPILTEANKTFATTLVQWQALKENFLNIRPQLLKFSPKVESVGRSNFLDYLHTEIHIPKIVEASLK